jgi:hypothetical protein
VIGLALLSRVPLLAWPLAVALAWGGVEHVRVGSLQARLDRQTAQQAAQTAAYARAAAEAASAALAETDRRLQAQQGAIHAAEIQIAQARADVVAADRARGSLQQRFAAVAARCGQARADPAPAGTSAPAGAPGVLLADVLSRLDARAGQLAAFGDASRTAGQACERSYDALTAPGR